jgi:thioredoxin 1
MHGTYAGVTIPAEPGAAPLLVACLCASWCTSCREYRVVFDRAAADHARCRFLWIDIEDSAELLDEVDVENFPTILIGVADSLRFFGPVTPHPDVLARLIATQLEGEVVRTEASEEGVGLLRRLQGLVE